MFYRQGAHCVTRFQPGEAQMLRQCFASLTALLSARPDHDHPIVARLFPDTYPDAPTDSAEFRRYTEDDLLRAKREQAAAVLSGLPASGGEVALDEESADTWLRALTDIRLVLGTTLDIRDDTDLVGEMDDAVMRDPTSLRVSQLVLYEYLVLLQESLVDALTGPPE